MTEGKTDKTNTDALITNQEETVAMIFIEEAKILISNSIEKYKQRSANIKEETNMVIEDNISSTENTALLSVSYILINYKTDSQKANQQITTSIKERYNQKVTSLGYIFPLDTLVTRPFNSLIRIQTIVVKVASYFIFALGGRRLMLETKATSITNSIGYEGMQPAYAVSTSLGEDEANILIPVVNHSIQLENICKESIQNPNLNLPEENFYFLQRSSTGGRRILTNMSGFRSHPLTRNLVKRISQVVNCLKKMHPMEDSPEKRDLGMTVRRQTRIITSMVVVVDKTNTSEAKILNDNSRLSYWTTEDVARIAQFMRNSNMQSLFEDIANTTQEKELALLERATKVWKTDQDSPNKLYQRQTIEGIKTRTDLNAKLPTTTLQTSKPQVCNTNKKYSSPQGGFQGS